jgi:hypothetical protein
MGLHDAELRAVGLGLEHPGVALFGGQTLGRTLNVENDSAGGQHGAQLLSLDAANLFVVRGDGKYGYIWKSRRSSAM